MRQLCVNEQHRTITEEKKRSTIRNSSGFQYCLVDVIIEMLSFIACNFITSRVNEWK